MEKITDTDLKGVYCPYRQGQCVSTCAMLVYVPDSVYVGEHSLEEVDVLGHHLRVGVYQRYTNYWCGLARTEYADCVNKIKVVGMRVCNDKPFDGLTDEEMRDCGLS